MLTLKATNTNVNYEGSKQMFGIYTIISRKKIEIINAQQLD